MNEKQIFEEEAEIIRKEFIGEEESSVITILMIISIIINILKLINACKERAGEVKNASTTQLSRNRISKVVFNVIGPQLYRIYGPRIVNAFANRGQVMSMERLENLLQSLDA